MTWQLSELQPTGVIRSAATFGSAHRCNLVEEPLLGAGAADSLTAEAGANGGTTLWVTLRPFEVCTIMLREAHDGSVLVSGSKL